MRGLPAVFLAVSLSSACGDAPPPRPPESSAFVQDPARPNIVHGTEGVVEGAPEVGLKDGHEVTVDGATVAEAGPKKTSDGLGRALEQKKSRKEEGRVAYALDRDTQWT